MKIYITNNYGFIPNKKIADQQKTISNVAHNMGYSELGIYNYDVESDTEEELEIRIEGITTAVGNKDIVVVQLPTGNGIKFDEKIVQTLYYKRARVVLLWHSLAYYEKNKYTLSIWTNYDILPEQIYNALDTSKLMVTKMLVDACFNASKVIEDTDETIHIGMGVHDKDGNYCSWLGITIQSLVEHTNMHVHFHILHDDTLSERNKRKLEYIVARSNNSISFYLIDKNMFGESSKRMGIYTIGTLFRILLPEICMNLKRIIYLDSDLLVNCDIRNLWEIDISEYCLAAVPDKDIVEGRIGALAVNKNGINRERYFNAGVIYMNLEKIRKQGNMRNQVIEYLENNHESNLPDQDALNTIYNNSTLLLEEKWNRFAKHVRANKEIGIKDCIYHYVGNICVLYFGTQMDLLYFETANNTPWKNEFFKSCLQRSFGRQNVRIDNLEKILYEITITNKKIIFYGYENYAMENMCRLLSVSDCKAYRVLETPDTTVKFPCKSLKQLENERKGDFIVFVAPETDNGKAIENLNNIGLELQKDYFVIPNVLGQLDGGYI
ncbi:glycosyltransferase [Agathobacter sp.]